MQATTMSYTRIIVFNYLKEYEILCIEQYGVG